MTKTQAIKLSPFLSLPISAVTQKLAFLGISGSGKSWTASKFAEELLDIGAQVVIVDVVGNWHGLRLAADGKKPGIAIPILGGLKGDIPLDSTAGRLAAETVSGSRASMILDVSDFTRGELCRFVADFATELLRLKKKSPSPVMIIWEECQDVVPQRVMGEMARTVGAVERLIKKGRNYGIGTALISQRPAAVNKDVLSQIETLFAFRMNGKHDRKAMAEWIVEKDLDIAALIDELPSMKTGTCYVWSPEWLGIFEKVAIGKKWTFDATKTPEFGSEVKAGALAPVDLEKFKTTMSAAVEKAKANDPEMLKARIRILERAVEVAEKAKPVAIVTEPTKIPKIIEKPVLKEKDLDRLEAWIEKLDGYRIKLDSAHRGFIADVENVRNEIKNARRWAPVTLSQVQAASAANGHRKSVEELARDFARKHPTPTGSPVTGPAKRRDSWVANAGSENLTGPQQRVLDALAWFEAIGVPSPETVAVAFKARYSGENGTFNNIRAQLRGAGLVEYGDGTTALTDAGRKAARGPKMLPTTAELQDEVLSILNVPQRRVLQRLLDAYPQAVNAATLATMSGYGSVNGTFNNIRGRLRTMGLVEYPGSGMTRARSILFL